MNKASLRLMLDWLDKNNLYELLPDKPARPIMGRNYKRILISNFEYVNNDRLKNNAYTTSMMKIFFFECPVIHSYGNSDGLHISPEANVILKLIIANNFDITIDYKDICEFANV